MFEYPGREGTYALRKMPDDVFEGVKGKRLQHIIKLQGAISRELNKSRLNGTVEVLVRGPSKGSATYGKSR